MRFQLTSIAQDIINLGTEDASNIPMLSDFIDKCSGSDDFWYRLTNGYIPINEILQLESDVKKINDAIKIIEEFEKIIDMISWEM